MPVSPVIFRSLGLTAGVAASTNLNFLKTEIYTTCLKCVLKYLAIVLGGKEDLPR